MSDPGTDLVTLLRDTSVPTTEIAPLYPQDDVGKSLIDAALEAPEEDKALVERNPDGTFPKGVSGNPKGRTKGIKNRVTFARLLVEEALRRKLASASDRLLNTAINQALNGNDRIMRVLLDKMLASPKHDDSDSAKDTSVTVVIENHTDPQKPSVVATRAAKSRENADEAIVVIPSDNPS